jgi:ABC-type sugar transport system ATPase subunit
MIRLENISHSYGKKEIIHNLNLEFHSNELHCLLGSSGCGKTTILRIIAGLETPHNGSLYIDNQLYMQNGNNLIAPHQRDIGFVFQDLALWPHFTVFENIAFGLKERKELHIEEKVNEILDFFDISQEVKKYPHQLSGGQQQLVAIARSLVLHPNILLMDEPLANLDVKLKRKILKHILNLKNNLNLTIIYVTHDHKEAFAIADNISILDEGKVIESGSVEKIKNSSKAFVHYFLEYQ